MIPQRGRAVLLGASLAPAKDEIVQRTRDVLDACSLDAVAVAACRRQNTECRASGRSRCERLTRRALDFRRRCLLATIWVPRH